MNVTGPALGVTTIDHITIVVTDLERSAQFYVNVLGMEPVPRPNFAFPGRWFQAGRTQIHLNLAGPEAGGAGLASSGGTSPSRGFHYAFHVDDGEAAAARLRELNIPIVEGPRLRPDGGFQLYVRDPDGHLIEIVSPPAAVS